MNQKDLKKEFKQKCKEEKAKCYRYSFIGGILAAVGFVIVFATLVLDQSMSVFRYQLQLVCYGAGVLCAVVGMVLDGIGEVMLNRQFKNYRNTNK